jgi:hypothetical protein
MLCGVADETSSSSALTGVGCECGKRNVKQSGTGWYGLWKWQAKRPRATSPLQKRLQTLEVFVVSGDDLTYQFFIFIIKLISDHILCSSNPLVLTVVELFNDILFCQPRSLFGQHSSTETSPLLHLCLPLVPLLTL